MKQNRNEPHPVGRVFSKLRAVVLVLALALFVAGCAGWFGGKKAEKTAEELAREATSYFEAEKYSKALKSYERLRDWYPYSVHAKEAKLRIADAHFQLKEYEQALQAYEQYEQLHPSDQQIPYVIYQMGMCHYKRVKSIDRTQVPTRNALEAFLRLRSRFPESRWAQKSEEKIARCRKHLAGHEYYVGRFYAKSGQQEAAMNRFETLVRQYPDVSEYTRKARRYLEQHGRHLASDGRRHVQDGWVQLPPIELEWEATN